MIKKGVMFGLIMGLVVTFFDGLPMLFSRASIPFSYPWFVLIFNVCFWIICEVVIALFLWLFCFYKKSIIQSDSFSQTFFSLIFFALTYGFLGCLPLRDASWTPEKPFDFYASFLWVSGIFLFLLIFKKKVFQTKSLPIACLPEIVAITALFQFCFNLKNIIVAFKPFGDSNLYLNNKFIFALYGLGVLLILIAYLASLLNLTILNRKSKKTLVVLVLIVLLSLNGFFLVNQIKIRGDGYLSAVSQNQPPLKKTNVFLIVLDTVRANRLSPYAPLNTTKNLEAFSKDAVVYENCISPSSWTLPSHASLFTGLYPVEHGLTHNINDDKFFRHTNFEKFTTLAELFKDNSYHTAGIVANAGVVNSVNNLDKGFKVFDALLGLGSMRISSFSPPYNTFIKLTHVNSVYRSYYRPAEQINKVVFENLDPSPLFMFINYMDAHGPYSPPRPFNAYFTDQKFPHFFKIKQYLGCTFFECPDEEAVKLFKQSQYDGEIAYLDHHLGEFFLELKRRGIYDSALIVVTSDHGEFLGEHELYGHTGDILLYNEVVKVPLIIKFPNNSNVGKEKRLITLSDVYSTILAICDIPIPEYTSGKAFGRDSTPVVASLNTKKQGKQRSLFLGDYKYISYEKNRMPELYNLKTDVEETVNLVENLPKVTFSMKNRLEKWTQEHKPKYKIIDSNKKKLPQEVINNLKGLGYLQ